MCFVKGADLSDPFGSAGFGKTPPQYWNGLYRNLGEWRFRDIVERTLVVGQGYGMGAAMADYEGDGVSDQFVTNFGPKFLFRNEGYGTFQDASRDAGIAGDGWSSEAALPDYDNDGHLDLFVAGHLAWTFENSEPCPHSVPIRRSYCHLSSVWPC